MQYYVVKVFGLPAFMNEVNRLMVDGWEPSGSVSQVSVSGMTGDADQWFVQAMVRSDANLPKLEKRQSTQVGRSTVVDFD